MIANIRKNAMGTISFDAKFKGMRKEQDFIVYPISAGDVQIKVQSDTRIGYINVDTGAVIMTKSITGGAYFHHLVTATAIDAIIGEELSDIRRMVEENVTGPVVRVL